MKKSTLNVPPILWFWPKLKLYLKISHFPGFVGYNPVSSYYMSLLLLLSIVVWRSYSHFSVQLASGLFWVALRLVHISSSAHWPISPPGFLDLYLQILLRLMRQECKLLATKWQKKWTNTSIGKELLVYFLQQLPDMQRYGLLYRTESKKG